MPAIDIDVVSDVVCPWCFIGTRNLELALESLPDVQATVRFRPFLLDPDTPPGGADLRERLRHKYGVDPDTMFGRVEAAARASGIPLDFSRVRRSVSTVAAHTLLRTALEVGGPASQGALARAIFQAYFLEGRDVGQADVLVELATAQGIDDGAARRALGDEAELARTREEASEAAAGGIRGVPFFILAGRFALSGAQPSDVMRSAVTRALTAS